MVFSPESEVVRYATLLVAASFAYSSAAMPVMTKLAVASNSFNSVGAVIDNSDSIVSDTTVDGFQMSSPKIGAYSPSSVLPAKSIMYQFTLTSDFPSASPQASQIVVFPTALAISCPPAPSTVTPMPTCVTPNATVSAAVSVPAWTNGTMRRARGHSRGILGLVFVYAVLQVL
ncbi:hypothetical protein F5141DRAFT_486831 [Pisolithus sp. B1]|nr:hypothetical protein F5141DRAFT_561870 [Pisolithus sp. B1]KAI6096816.1 hypothetical protein F5141DRAFT_486831 [Pisolithus sp. B1]